ncbi:GNAT family N-acetyltransferase [Kitasatospora sp. NPDC094015]|uniref:GNAT family N-acetyltransferase n=1 Tax=Kitasatospora sp. NPDC094015 TaxID=3155205 RepID=UPI003331047A
MTTEPQVTDNPAASRFEIRLAAGDAEPVGFVEYHLSDGEIAFLHTETAPGHEGLGLAGTLVRAALDSARHRQLAVLPYCPFVRVWIGRNREYTDLVPVDRRARFDL